jgi:hypothetical protein
MRAVQTVQSKALITLAIWSLDDRQRPLGRPACSFDKKVEAIVVEQQRLGHVPEIESNTTPV